jgi:hypothetical protein
MLCMAHGLAPAFNQRQEQKRDRRLIPDPRCGSYSRRLTGRSGREEMAGRWATGAAVRRANGAAGPRPGGGATGDQRPEAARARGGGGDEQAGAWTSGRG